MSNQEQTKKLELAKKCKEREDISNEEECVKNWPARCPPKFKNSAMGAIITIIAIVSVIFLFADNPAIAIAMVGGIVFFATLTLADYASPDVAEPGLSTGEMRSAISATVIVVYILVVGFFISGKTNLTTEILNSFSGVVIAVVGFYFGTKGIAEIQAAAKK